MKKAYFHLPGLFEFYDLYALFLPLYRTHREYFYDFCEIASVYGAPAHCLWGGGRVSTGTASAHDVLSLMGEYGVSARLTFSNSLLRPEHLSDSKCNSLCKLFAESASVPSGVIVHSDLLLQHLQHNYPGLYFVSSTTKVLTDFHSLENELRRDEFSYVVPDFRLNKAFSSLDSLPQEYKNKLEFLCNECCWVGCTERQACYQTVSRMNLGEACPEHLCTAPGAAGGYRFSLAMQSPAFISISDIQQRYLPSGFSNFKIEGRSLGSALVLEFLLYYLTKPEYHLPVREAIYLDNMLDLF